jgi:predicted enzyme related to lactoylglutathione lyase
MTDNNKPITVQGIYACVAVADFEAGVSWYATLMGREPDDRPMPTLAQWRNMDRAGLQVWDDRERAGKSLVTIVVPVLATERERLMAAGITFSEEAEGDFGRVAKVHDPEGNQIALAEPPRGFTGR